ncbi:hypothetical protein [Spiroplasma endosymbiont of Colias croceus]
MLEHFGYLNDILKQMYYKKPLTVKRIDQFGWVTIYWTLIT